MVDLAGLVKTLNLFLKKEFALHSSYPSELGFQIIFVENNLFRNNRVGYSRLFALAFSFK